MNEPWGMLSKWDREKLISYLYVESKKHVKLIDTGNRLVVAGGVGGMWMGEMGESGQKLQNSHYKVNKSWECNI